MVQASTQHFLLEKSRLVAVASEERNYHVFYQLLKGLADTPLGDDLLLGDPTELKMTSGGGCVTVSLHAINQSTNQASSQSINQSINQAATQS